MLLNATALTVIRERSGLSKAELARRAGISPGGITNLEAGRKGASEDAIKRLAAALEVPVTAIIQGHPLSEVAP